MRKKKLTILFIGLLFLYSPTIKQTAAKEGNASKIYATLTQMEEKVKALENKLAIQEDTEKIRTLMYTYTYYMDRALYDQALDLFSEDIVSCEIGGRGVYLGKEGCRTLWQDIYGPVYGGAENQLKFGWLVNHYVTKLVITVAPDRKSAKSRGHYFSLGGIFNHPEYTSMQTGIYQLEYVNQNGIWKISKFWLPLTTTGYNFSTWAQNPGYSGCPDEQFLPDLPTSNYHPFPEVYVVPFHYPNPVTGNQVPQNGYTDPRRYWQGNWPDEWGLCGSR